MKGWLKFPVREVAPYFFLIIAGLTLSLFVRHSANYEMQWFSAETLEATFTLAIAIFAFVQIRDSRRSSERQLRAYISVESGDALIVAGQKATLEINITNKGQTPAYYVAVASRAGTDAFPERVRRVDLLVPEGVRPSLTLNPNQGKKATVESDNPISQVEINEITANRLRLYFEGAILYEDTFGQPRHSQFSFVFSGIRRSGQVRMELAEDGNDSN